NSQVESILGHYSGIKAQSDGCVLVWGDLHYFVPGQGGYAGGLVRLKTDGSFDPTFTPLSSFASHLLLQSDGKIVVGGSMTDSDGLVFSPLFRLLNDYSGAGALEFSSPRQIVTERATNVTLTLRRVGSTIGTVAVQVAVAGVEASPETDFTPFEPQLVTWA